MDKQLNGGVNIFINEPDMKAQIDRLTIQAEKLNKAIASGSNAADLTAQALKKMADKESDLKNLQNAATALKSEIDQMTKAGGNATDQIRQLGTTTAAILNVEKQIGSLRSGIESTARSQADLNTNMSKLADVKDKISTVEKQMSGQLSPSLNQASAAVRKLNAELAGLPIGSKEYNALKPKVDEANAAFKQMQGSVKGVKDSLHAAGEEGTLFGHVFKEVFSALTIEHGIEKALEVTVDFFKESIKEALELEVTQARLKNILVNFGKGEDLEKFNAKAEELSKKFSYLYAPEITKVQTQLVTFGKLNNEQIDQLLPVIINFSAKYGRSMSESGEIVLKALEGNRKSLHDMGIEIKQGSNFADNYGIVLKQLGQRVEGAADAFGKTGAGAIAQYNKQLKELQEQLGNQLLPAFTSGAGAAIRFLQVLSDLPKFIVDNRQAIIALAGAYVVMNAAQLAAIGRTTAHTVATVANAIAERASTVAKTAGFIATGLYQVAYAVLTSEISLATAATAVFGVATAAASGGLTLIIAAVAAVGTAVAVYAARMTEAEEVERRMAEVRGAAEKSIAKERTQLDLLVQTAKDEALSKEKRLKAIQQINAINPEYLSGINLDNIGTKEGTEILNKYVIALQKEAQEKAIANKLTELHQQKIEAETRSNSDSVSWYQKVGIALSSVNGLYNYKTGLTIQATQNNYDEVKSIDAQIAALLKLAAVKGEKEDVKDPKAKELESLQKFYTEAAQYQKDFAALNVNSSTEEIEQVRKTYERLNGELAIHQANGIITLQKYIEVKRQLAKNDAVKEEEDAEQRARDRAKKDADERKKKEEQDKQAVEAFMKTLASLRNEDAILQQDENAKAIIASRDKFEKLYEFAKEHWGENGKITKELERYYADEVNRLNDKDTEKKYKAGYDNRVKLITNMYAELRTKAEDDKAAVIAIDIAEYDTLGKLAKDYTGVVKSAATDQATANENAAKSRIALEVETQKRIKDAQNINDSVDLLVAQINKDVEAETNAKLKALKHRYEQEQVQYKNNAAALLALARKYELDSQQIIDAGTKQTLQQVSGYYSKFASTLTQLVNSIVQFQNQADEATLTSAQTNTDKKKALLQQELDSKKISQDTYNKDVAALDRNLSAQQSQIKRDEFERNKQAQVIAAITTGITAVLNAYSDGLEAGGPAGPAVGAVFAALAGGFVGAQIALIESQPTPQFAKGGVANGSSHAQGGIAMVDSRSGRKVGEMEGGEPYMILSGSTYRNNSGVINALLRSSMNEGGRSIDWSGAGRQPRFDVGGIMDTMRVMRYANGGIFNPTASPSTVNDSQLLAVLHKLASSADQPFRGYIVYDDIADGATRVNNARNRSSFLS